MLGNPVCSLIIRELAKTKVNWEKIGKVSGSRIKMNSIFTVDICRYETLESLGKYFVPFVHMHLPSAFQGITLKCAR